MLDIKFIRENAERVADAAAKKGYKNVDIAALLETDERRDLQQQVDELRTKRNDNAAKNERRQAGASAD